MIEEGCVVRDETGDKDFFDVVSGTDAVTPASADAVTPAAEEGTGRTTSASESYKVAGLDAYNKGQYISAIEQFNSYLDIEGTKEQHEIRFIWGLLT